MTESKTKYIFKVKIEFIFKQASDPAFFLHSFLKQAVNNDEQTGPSHSLQRPGASAQTQLILEAQSQCCNAIY